MTKQLLKIYIMAMTIAATSGLNPAGFPRANAQTPSKGRIIVRSNVMTNWVIFGPENFSGSGNFGSYYAIPGTGDYFISAPGIVDSEGNVMNGPIYPLGMNQTLRAGETIYFDINYNYGELTGPENCLNAFGYLEGRFINDGKSTGIATATMTNKSATCTYTVGIASYKMYEVELSKSGDDGWLNSQTLYQTKTFTLAPGQTLGPDVVQVAIPPCRTQLDLFEGIALTPPVYNTEGHFLMDYRFVDKEICELYETGILTVNSNIPTTWVISGPQNFSGSGVYGGYTARVGEYVLNSVPTTLLYNDKTYELTSVIPQTQSVSVSTLTQFVIEYAEKWTINKPTISGATNAQCSKISVSWNDASNNESGFLVYRSTLDSADLSDYQLIASLPANTTSYIDSPGLNTSYYYIIAAFSNSPRSETLSNRFYSGFNTPCNANLEGNLRLVAVNGSENFNSNALQTGDVLTFELLIDNLGPADGYITKINETVSNNLINPRNLQASGSNMVVGNPKIIGSNPEFTLNISGKKSVGGNKWVIRYDITALFTSAEPTTSLSNCATIYYYDQIGEKTDRVCSSQLVKAVEQNPGLKFREVAP